MSYSLRAAQGTQPKWFEFFLARDSETIPFTLNEEELATILYSDTRFGFGEHDVIKVDMSAMKSVKIKVRAEVNLEDHKTTRALQVRAGLYVQPMKEVKQEKIVKLSWLPSDVPDEAIIEVLEMFGKVTRPPMDAKFVIKDNASQFAKRLRNVFSNDKTVEMLIESNIPSYIKIQDRKVKVWYRGQEFTCARCFQSYHQCPGRAVAKTCQSKNPSLKVEFNDYWQNFKHKKPYREMMGEEEEVFDTETLRIYSFPKDASREQVHNWLKSIDVNIDIEKLLPTTTPTSWYLKHVGKENVKDLVKKIRGKIVGSKPNQRYIQCDPVNLTTPQKDQYAIRRPQSASFDKDKSATVEHYQPSEQDRREATTSGGEGSKANKNISDKNHLNTSDKRQVQKTDNRETNSEKVNNEKQGPLTSLYNMISNAWSGKPSDQSNISTATTLPPPESTSSSSMLASGKQHVAQQPGAVPEVTKETTAAAITHDTAAMQQHSEHKK